MAALNPNTVISDSLETAFGLKRYVQIVEEASKPNFVATANFRTLCNGYYKIRSRTLEWYNCYYSLMENQKGKVYTFRKVLCELYKVSGNIEASFASKLLATIDPNLPIWDKYVLKHLGFDGVWDKKKTAPYKERIDIAVEIYENIKIWYDIFLKSANGQACIDAFDNALPKYKNTITDVKRIDFLLWSKR